MEEQEKELEEKVTRSFCLEGNPDLIINIVDATSRERSLYLTTQLRELDCDVIIARNRADILEKKGITIDFKKLEEELGVSVVRISAKTGEGIQELIHIIQEKGTSWKKTLIVSDPLNKALMKSLVREPTKPTEMKYLNPMTIRKMGSARKRFKTRLPNSQMLYAFNLNFILICFFVFIQKEIFATIDD